MAGEALVRGDRRHQALSGDVGTGRGERHRDEPESIASGRPGWVHGLYDVVNILTKKRQRLVGLEIEIAGEQEPDPPWTYRKIHLTYRLRGRGLKEKAVRDVVELSKNRYCSVGATPGEAAEITYDYVIEEEQ